MAESASKSDHDSHVRQDWKQAHAIWANVKAYIDARELTYVPLASAVDLFALMTKDANWHDLDLSSYVPATVHKIRVQVELANDAASFDLRLRPNGSTKADGEERSRYEIVDASDANQQARYLTDHLECSMVDQTVEYYSVTPGVTCYAYLVGYWKKGA